MRYSIWKRVDASRPEEAQERIREHVIHVIRIAREIQVAQVARAARAARVARVEMDLSLREEAEQVLTKCDDYNVINLDVACRIRSKSSMLARHPLYNHPKLTR